MDVRDMRSDTCSVFRTLDVLGDRWSVLVLRDVFNGIRRFADLQEHLGIARDVLTRRLASLVEDGVLTKAPYQDPRQRARMEYRLTDKGRDLGIVLLALGQWGDRYTAGEDGPPVVWHHADCGGAVEVALTCGEGHQLGSLREVRAAAGSGARPRHAS